MSVTPYDNPFQITSPEDLTAEETVSLFVDVFTDFQKIIDSGNVFLVGPRGAGKSMMFRYLQPDCQCLARGCCLKDLPFLGIYIPLKNTNFSLAELRRLENRHASDILNEHLLATHFCVKVFQSLAVPDIFGNHGAYKQQVEEYYNEIYLPAIVRSSSGSFKDVLDASLEVSDMFQRMAFISEQLYVQAIQYAKKLAFCRELIPYDGPLCDYLDFLFPIISNLHRLKGFPNGPVYLLIDDAHWLNKTQARVLNSWVATRTSRKVSLKVSTQYNYKTYYTTSGSTIDTPHDYSEIDIATIYTGSSKSKYRERITDIVEKRLTKFGINEPKAYDFFPEDRKQEDKIRDIAEKYKQAYDKGDSRGFYRTDDALRYARPDYIKGLAGKRKSSSKYSYAGFDQLVHLSSGIVRHFLHPAHLMYAKLKSETGSGSISSIPSSVQNEIVREEANRFLFSDLERVQDGGHATAPPKGDIRTLSNLIQGLGGLFRQILLSDRSERRVFSIAFSDQPSDEVLNILNLGIQLGYFHRSTIGRKDSKSGGRTRLYILNRRLAPIWNLDPTGFAGYLFVTNEVIKMAMETPATLLRRVASHGLPSEAEVVQLELFGDKK
ncbi:MAG: hypothetical protein KQJ78_21160 [Deltaproteobacteria bacterium]|nr:hypothetical protein [Deltaproteobacteria bacterium]